MKKTEEQHYPERHKAPGPCPDKAAGRPCSYPICDHYCGAPPLPIFGPRDEVRA